MFDSQSELLTYLDSDPVSEYDDDFNILSWWRDHRRAYPVLSILDTVFQLFPNRLFGIIIISLRLVDFCKTVILF
jgi:hypothetical protein